MLCLCTECVFCLCHSTSSMLTSLQCATRRPATNEEPLLDERPNCLQGTFFQVQLIFNALWVTMTWINENLHRHLQQGLFTKKLKPPFVIKLKMAESFATQLLSPTKISTPGHRACLWKKIRTDKRRRKIGYQAALPLPCGPQPPIPLLHLVCLLPLLSVAVSCV